MTSFEKCDKNPLILVNQCLRRRDEDCSGEHMVNFIRMEKFTVMLTCNMLLAILILVLMLSWILNYRNGFAWQAYPNLQFNWHPILTTVGMVVLYGNALLVFRALKNTKKFTAKLVHAFINLFGYVFTIIGLKAVFDSHNYADPPIPNMYSLHSWIGLSSVILITFQWLSGMIIFLWPGANAITRALYHPVHIYAGIIGLAFSTAAALIGFTEKIFFEVKDYSSFASEGILVNFMAILVLIYSTSVIYLASEPKYKRPQTAEDQNLLTPKN